MKVGPEGAAAFWLSGRNRRRKFDNSAQLPRRKYRRLRRARQTPIWNGAASHRHAFVALDKRISRSIPWGGSAKGAEIFVGGGRPVRRQACRSIADGCGQRHHKSDHHDLRKMRVAVSLTGFIVSQGSFADRIQGFANAQVQSPGATIVIAYALGRTCNADTHLCIDSRASNFLAEIRQR